MAKNDKTAQAFDMIVQGVKDVYSSDKFKNYLSCLSKFHNYSLNNTLLILYLMWPSQRKIMRTLLQRTIDL